MMPKDLLKSDKIRVILESSDGITQDYFVCNLPAQYPLGIRPIPHDFEIRYKENGYDVVFH